MNVKDVKDKIIHFYHSRKSYLFLALLGIFESVNLYVMRLFVVRRFPEGARLALAIFGSPEIQYNTEFYRHALDVVSVVASFFVGGIIVFILIKCVCKLATGFQLIDREWYGGIVLAAYVVLFGIGWGIAGSMAWLCPFAAYAGGLLFLLLSGVGLFEKKGEIAGGFLAVNMGIW